MDVCITNLLHNFTSIVFAPTCFGLESRPSSGSYEPFRRTRRTFRRMKWLVASWGWPRFTAETRRSEYNRYQAVQQVGNTKVYACNIIGWKLDSIKFSSWYVTVPSTDIWKRNWKWQFWFRPCLGKRKREMTEFLHTLTKTFHTTWYNSRTINSVCCCQQTELRVWKERDWEYPASGIENEVSLLALLKRGWL